MGSRLQATAVVEVTISVSLTQPWGHEATVAEVHKRAKEEALAKVRDLVHVKGHGTMRLGEAKVRVVMAEKGSEIRSEGGES